MSREQAIRFEVEGERMFGLLHLPERPARRGLVVITGGPTYRVGPHRTNVLLGRALAAAGTPVLRFDFRGTGDSDGDLRTLKRGDPVMLDMRAAVDALFAAVPELEEVVLWGLCRGAIRTLEYAPDDARVSGIVLLNPRVDNDKIAAVASIKHYYWGRLTNPDLYRKILSGRFDALQSLKELGATVVAALRGGASPPPGNPQGMQARYGVRYVPVETLIEQGFERFRGRILVVLGTADLESAKFREVLRDSPLLQRRAEDPEVDIRPLQGATHTFSTRESLDTVIAWTRDWIGGW